MIRKLKDRVRARFRIPLSEVGGQNTWQRVVLGFAIVGSDRQKVEALVDEIARFVDRSGLAELASYERELASYGEGAMSTISSSRWASAGTEEDPAAAMADDDSWIPESWKSDSDAEES